MADMKGVLIVFIRRRLRAAGEDVERRVVAQLTPEDRRAYESCTAGSWLPIETIAAISYAAAPALYPDAQEPIALTPAASPLVAMGRQQALEDLSGVYSFLVRVATVPFLLRQTARLWTTYHKGGKASVDEPPPDPEGRHRANMLVTDYPDFPHRYGNLTAGYIAEAMAMAGAKEVDVRTSYDDAGLHWDVSWR